MDEQLVEQQLRLESSMLKEAEARHLKDALSAGKRKESGASREGREYVKSFTKVLHPYVDAFVMAAGEKKGRRHAIASKLLYLTGLSTTTITYLTMKAVLNGLMFRYKSQAGIKRVTLCRLIGDIIHDEWRIKFFADDKERKKLLKKLFKDFDKRTYPRHWRKRTIKRYFDAAQLDWEGWDNRQKIHVGYALLCMFRQNIPFLKEEQNGTVFTVADEFMEQADKLLKERLPTYMLYRPMVVPPRPWTEDDLFRGGYLSNRTKRYAIVKGYGRKDLKRLDDIDWARVLPPINAIQETPWRVNKRMLDALRWAYREYTEGVGKLVRSDPIPLPPLPADYETDEAVKKAHRHKVFLIHDRNRQDKSKRLAAIMTIQMAEDYQNYKAIYFPHNLDSRGRAYPLPAFLTPQGADYQKALLEFAVGEPIGDEVGACWLAICGANAYGNDKVSLQERCDWVCDNEEMILSIAKDYKHDRRWMHAGEPFQFLRFCFEWAGFREFGYDYRSHMVVPVDATCSGLQHYAAMLRDEKGGKSVNLVPGLARQDIYGDVASVVIQKLVADRSSPFARAWLNFGIDRKITKRQVMVVPYAGKFSSCMAYTKEAVQEKLESGVLAEWDIHDDKDHHDRCVYLAQLIWQAIDEVVVKGKQAMQWLSSVASEWAKYANTLTEAEIFDKRMGWRTPDGFEVAHVEEDTSEVRLRTAFDGDVKLKLHEGNGKLKVSGMSLAVAPNFVHSLDATHLRLTVAKGLTMGIQHYAMVHDSFGVHAGRMDGFLKNCVKPAFIEMYRDHDPLKDLADRYANVITTPEMPSYGSLDIEAVQESEFFFS